MKKETSILIIEESFIIRVGLAAVLERNNNTPFCVEHYSVGCDLKPILIKNRPQVLMVNPLFFEANEKQIKELKEKQHFQTVGLVYTYHHPDSLAQFDALIHLNDKSEDIESVINDLLNTSDLSSQSNSNETLSKREKEILKLIVSGNKTKEIAEILFISAHTVNAHRKNIIRKLDIKTVSGLTIYAVLNNIISLNDV